MTLLQTISTQLKGKNYKIVTAESCTGGLLANYLTELPGSSEWFERGFITYSNQAKQDLLGVQVNTLKIYGAVSEETVREMAIGALENSDSQVSIAITGIAGPEGGSIEKPVGMVCFGFAGQSFKTTTQTKYFQGNRKAIREQAALFALKKLNEIIMS
jgi:nicotinamide-nucleotide amidase